MTVSSTSSRTVLLGNGVTTVWPWAFKILAAADLTVIYTDAAGVETTLSPSLYTATGFGLDAGGTVTYPLTGSPIATGTKLTLFRSISPTQPASISNQGAMWPAVIEAAFDRVVMIAQGFLDFASRALVAPRSDTITLNPLPTQTARANGGAGSLLGFDGTGQPYAAVLTTSLVGVATWLVNNFLAVATSAANACTALGAAYLPGNNDFLGTNTFPTQAQNDNSTKAATDAFVRAALSTGVRQTVASGPVSATTGLPSFLPATNAALSITTQNVTSSAPLVATAATGADAGGQTNQLGISTANLTWSGLTLNRAAATPNYLYGTIAGGTITPASTILAPVYQWGGVPATTAGQITLNIGEMKAYLGNGSAAVATALVLFGEAATDATTVISTVAYAYSGRYDSGFTATLPAINTTTTKSHNIGGDASFIEADLIAVCTTGDLGHAVGTTIPTPSLWASDSVAASSPLSLVLTAKTVVLIAANSASFIAINSTNAATGMTNASWKYKIVARRRW